MKYLIIPLILMIGPLFGVMAQKTETREEGKLMVIWTSADRDVALNVCLMYTKAANKMKWFDEVHLIIWGPSAKLLSYDKEVQAQIKDLQNTGVVVEACIVCTNRYGVTEPLKRLGIDVKAMGLPLTERLKTNWKQLNF